MISRFQGPPTHRPVLALMLIPMFTMTLFASAVLPASGQTGAQPGAQPAAQTAQTPGAIGSAAPAKASVDQLGWIAGPWRGMLGERQIEQHWMAPAGGAMLAMYRSVEKQRASLYELLAIEQQGDNVFLRIKHFQPGPGLVGRQAKEESVDHALVRVEGKTAVFEGTGANPSRVTFSSADPDNLLITVERVRDGKPVSTDFKYSRIKS